MAHRRVRADAGTLAVALALALTGCGDEDPGAEPDSPPVATETTDGGPTEEPEEPGQTASVDPSIAMPEGSGCEPGSGDLPDGQWYGTVEGLTPDDLELDLACWFIGEDAVMAAEEDGAESPPPNDYYVRDASDQARIVPVSPDASVTMYPTGSPEQQSGTVADLIEVAETRDGYPYAVWIEVEGGSVVNLQEQWVP